MTKKTKITIFVCVPLAILFIVGISLFILPPMNVAQINCPTELPQTGVYPANNRQEESTVWLGCYNGKIYYYGKNKSGADYTKYDHVLCVFQEGTLVEIASLSHGVNVTTSIVGIVDEYLYYLVYTSGNYQEKELYCFNLERNKATLLYTGDVFLTNAKYFADDKSVYVPLNEKYGKETEFVHILGEKVLGVEPLTEGYPVGERIYYVEYVKALERVVETDLQGNILCEEISFGPAYDRLVIPYADGILVHNMDLQSLLYRIDKNGNVTELFNIPCLSSRSTVNIHGTDAYISVLRYEKNGELGQIRYENDTAEGTYRISLIDGTVEKINDICFDGIYKFDDAGFYCCTREGEIYRMAFDGTTQPVLQLEENPLNLLNLFG